ncbi:MAG: FAD-dependent oxidoreductase [Gemmatimonadota bacterium]|nr:FAD-dependent oxidoreductase [Gemmatimonadota bacterium]
MPEPRVVILGGGPAGVGAAWRLRVHGKAQVTLFEQGERLGGNAGSFEFGDQRVDFGSHRLHPATEPAIMTDIQTLLGGDLLDRPRHGRIGLMGRWIHFPLKPLDLALRLPPSFGLGAARDAATKRFRAPPAGAPENFASVLRANLGPTICDHFYFPYARKIWGRPPEELSAIQARRRVSAGSFGKLVRKVLSAVPGLKPPGAGRFFYPRKGFGQICEGYAEAARKAGAEIRLGWRVVKLAPPASSTAPWLVTAERNGEQVRVEADHVWSTLPITLLATMLDGPVPDAVRTAAQGITYRAMILIYLQLDVAQFTEFDAHYFPAANLRITRLSEPKNYSVTGQPAGTTVLCAELPCDPTDAVWSMSDVELGALVTEDLKNAGVPLPRAAVAVLARRLKQAYPIYTPGYERPFAELDAWSGTLPRLLTYGRQGLFAHDNTHHALAMAYRAVDCLHDGRFDAVAWKGHRAEFETHVVED